MTIQPIAKGLYLTSILLTWGLSMVLLFISGAIGAQGGREAEMAAGSVACAALPLIIFGTVMLMILVYKLWASIQGGPARTTPGKAVGFLFIPFFNIYWIFQVYWGWAQDYNRYVDELGLPLPRVSEGLALAVCILMLAGIVPGLGILLSLASFVLLIVFLNSACNAVNALVAAADDLAATAGPPADQADVSHEWD